MSVLVLARAGAELARIRNRHARVSAVASTAGGGWLSHIPSPGGVMEEDRRPRGAGP